MRHRSRPIPHLCGVLPDTQTIAIVLGDSPLERFWLGEARKEFAQFANRVSIEWLNNLSLGQMRHRLATLPAHSYTVEADRSAFAFLSKRHNYVLFSLENRDGRFWSEYLGANAGTVFSRKGIPDSLYVSPHPRTHSINGDGIKTYGLYVDGS